MEIYSYIIQNKTDSGTRLFSADRTQGQKQRLDIAPFNISTNRIGEDFF